MESLSLKNICNELSTVKHKLHPIGIQLGIPHHKLKEFEKQDCPFTDSINYWLDGNVEGVSVSWESIVNAISSEHVDEKGLAREIAKKYGVQTEKG